MHKLLRAFLFLFILLFSLYSNGNPARAAKNTRYFQLKVYHYTSIEQEAMIDAYLQNRFIPSLTAAGIGNIGVFKAITNDTAADKKMFVFVPFSSLKQWEKYSSESLKSGTSATTGVDYESTPYDKPAYTRMENILLKAFELMPKITPSKLTAPKNERVYELRSYESASENIYRNKVQMFNQGGEIDIFSRLGFNPVFYSEVIFGSKMPNLMYMTSFDSMKSREEHWKAFGEDPAWKTLSSLPQYQKNVSHNDIYFLRPTEYSQL